MDLDTPRQVVLFEKRRGRADRESSLRFTNLLFAFANIAAYPGDFQR